MNIVFDIGNSSVKCALFEDRSLRQNRRFSILTESIIHAMLQEVQPQACIVSSVRPIESDHLKLLQTQIPRFYQLTCSLPVPLRSTYRTPRTLGMDRIAAAVGATVQCPNRNLLIIDIGTAITIDYVTAEGVFCGGNITPGPELRLRALHTFTSQLPAIDIHGDTPELGFDTQTAIRSGVMNGIARELSHYINDYQQKADVCTFLTGGYTHYFEQMLKNNSTFATPRSDASSTIQTNFELCPLSRIFADENLVLKGLNEILQYNETYHKQG